MEEHLQRNVNKSADSSLNKHNPKLKIETKPFSIKRFKQAETLKEKILARIGILFFSLPFLGIFIFTYCMLYCSFYLKFLTVSIAILQNFIPSRVKYYFDFVSFFETHRYYKSFTCICEEEIQTENCLLPSHPHGIIANVVSASILNGFSFLKKVEIFGTRFIRFIPVGGLFARMIGIEGVDNKNFKKRMNQRKNILFIPGGFECATITDDTKDKVYIKKRKGFIKYALMFGYKVHPIYNFGENKLYYTFKKWKFIEKIGLFLNNFKLPGIVFIGKYLIFPRDDIDVCTVIGKGIQFPKIENPNKDQIDKYHSIYINSLEELYDRYKNEFGASEKLEIH